MGSSSLAYFDKITFSLKVKIIRMIALIFIYISYKFVQKKIVRKHRKKQVSLDCVRVPIMQLGEQ